MSDQGEQNEDKLLIQQENENVLDSSNIQDMNDQALGGKHMDFADPEIGQSRRTKRVLVIVIVAILLLIAALAFFGIQFVLAAQEQAVQQAVQQSHDVESMKDEEAKESTSATKRTMVPSLTSLIGKNETEVVEALADYGAATTSMRDINEEGNPIKRRATVALTEEPGDSRSGTPTVYLGLNEEGRSIMAGYSAATSSLGYGSISFADAVSNEHIVENTLREAGLQVEDGAAVLPADKIEYSTYASDGVTLVKESCTFEGAINQEEKAYTWSVVLLYDYATANQSGVLADTIRQIFVYINEA